jgi:hypothetical protein
MSLAATMPTLPEELLALIFEQLASPNIFEVDEQLDDFYTQYKAKSSKRLRRDHSARISTLRNICLASKTMHRLAWPILYRDFSNRQTKDLEGRGRGVDSEHETPTRKFLRTICLTPHYGLAVRNLLIRGWDPIAAMQGEDIFDLLQSDATVLALFQWRARGFWFQDPEFVYSLHRTLSLGHEDGLITLLVIMCPKLRELEFAPPIEFQWSLFMSLLDIVQDREYQKESLPQTEPDFEQEEADYIIAQMFGAPWPGQRWRKPQFLQHLSKLTLWSPGLENMDNTAIAKIMKLPSLLTLEVHGMQYLGNLGHLLEAFNNVAGPVKLRELHLLDITVATPIVAAILGFCSKLEQLTLVWNNLHNNTAFRLEYDDIAMALELYTPELRTLSLDASPGWEAFGPKKPFSIGHRLESLQHLKDLTLDDRSIYGSWDDNSGSTLGANVPKGVTSLLLSAGYCDGEDPEDDRLIHLYRERQDKDLIAFLQDPAYDRLSNVELPGRSTFPAQEQAVVRKHGWEILPQRPDETFVHLVNPSRSRTGSAPITHATRNTEP